MKTFELLFWILAFVIFYTYAGYGLLLFVLTRIKKKRFQTIKTEINAQDLPEITLLVAAFNEKDYVTQKVQNTRQLDYPANKLKQIWVTDGSNDGTPELLKSYNDVWVLHQPARKGKIAALNRAMKYVKTPLVIFSDANTLLGKSSIKRIAKLFSNPDVGCVSGEKRIANSVAEAAASAGEGLYWKYESALKKWDAQINTAVGAAGELFSVRTHLFKPVEPDTILDDFIISLRIAMQGYTIQYDPEAFAIERASANVKEELKRKIRIATGGLQSIVRLKALLNIFRYKTLSFQYISHRVLRWTIAPVSLVLIFVFNILLLGETKFYQTLFALQMVFYLTAILGWIFEHKNIKIKALFVPYYFFIMNYAVFAGMLRYAKKTQSVNWERAKRA